MPADRARLPELEVTESARLRRISSDVSRLEGGAMPPSCRRPSRILEGRCQAVNRERARGCQAVNREWTRRSGLGSHSQGTVS